MPCSCERLNDGSLILRYGTRAGYRQSFQTLESDAPMDDHNGAIAGLDAVAE
jgi:hypothetical protein